VGIDQCLILMCLLILECRLVDPVFCIINLFRMYRVLMVAV
jgi:hypothetical protein